MKMKTEILKLLRETDGYVSGQQISGQFGVSRTAVWKVIRSEEHTSNSSHTSKSRMPSSA